MFQLRMDEARAWWAERIASRLRSQFATLKRGQHPRHRDQLSRKLSFHWSCGECLLRMSILESSTELTSQSPPVETERFVDAVRFGSHFVTSNQGGLYGR